MGTNQVNMQQSGDSFLVGFQNKTLTLCYANSVLQILFHHPIFDRIVNSFESTVKHQMDIMTPLKEMMAMSKKKSNNQAISTSKFMKFVQDKSGIFERDRHQDSHQFYIWLMNCINDQIKKQNKATGKEINPLEAQFFSKRTTRTQCLNCKTITERDEEEVDLSLFLPEPNISLNYCIQHYSKPQRLSGSDKFSCDHCNSLQSADKRTLIKTLPKLLTVHLRRFKYDQIRKGIIKLLWLIPFPTKLKLRTNYTPLQQDPSHRQKEGLYKLVGAVAHLGQGQNYGHYVSYLRIRDKWYLFNDDEVNQVQEHMLDGLWGYKGLTKCAYMLFYSLV